MDETTRWREIVDIWESKEIRPHLIWWCDCCNKEGYQFKPYVGKFASLILAFGSTIYSNAYSYDNLTSVLYSSFIKKLSDFEGLSDAEFKEQHKKLMTILEKMPQGFTDYSIRGERFLSSPDETEFSIKKAREFLDFLKSDEYEEIMMDIVTDGN